MKHIRILLMLSIPCLLHASFMTITKSGDYTLNGDIICASSTANDSVIRIQASDVILNLSGRTISQGAPQSSLTGILVDANLTNVTIAHGTVRNITGTGIVIGPGCSQIKIDNVTVDSCTSRGIVFAGTAGTGQITNSEIINFKIVRCCQSPIGDFGLFIQQASELRVMNGRCSNNGAASHPTSAVRLDNASTVRLLDIRANSNIGSTAVHGFDFSFITDCLIIQCTTRRNQVTSPGGLSSGYTMQDNTSCNKNKLKSCTAFAITATPISCAVQAYKVGTGNNGNLFVNCEARNNSATGNTTGFVATGDSNNLFLNCIALQNQSTNGSAKGFDLSDSSNNKLLRCLAHNQLSANGAAIGIDINTCTNCSFEECIAETNNGVNDANSFGFRLYECICNSLIKNVAIRNGSSANIYNQFSGLPPFSYVIAGPHNIGSIKNPWINVGII